MIHRDRVVAAMERYARQHSPAGFWPINELYPWATVAGSCLHCARCATEGRAPSPRDRGYDAAVEAFLEAHKRCREAA